MGGCQGGRREGGPWGHNEILRLRFAALRMTCGGRCAALEMACGEEEGRFPKRPYGNDGWERYAALGMA